ncbi:MULTISPECIES: hypothetical protein [unclassified Streptomyces]|uniref:hypothetical protein n=1 Tax=unclassified Streptomyces TaxID=2593676 RepID=UPI0013A6DAD9|nr:MULTISPECIES: hypothetical protein [unclassified Streptomyces]
MTATATATAALGLSGIPVHGAAAAEGRGYIVVLKDSVASPAATARSQMRSAGWTMTSVHTRAVHGYAATMTPSQATALAKDP